MTTSEKELAQLKIGLKHMARSGDLKSFIKERIKEMCLNARKNHEYRHLTDEQLYLMAKLSAFQIISEALDATDRSHIEKLNLELIMSLRGKKLCTNLQQTK